LLALVLQARMDSTRLPGKSLLPLGGEPLVFRVMEALSRIPADVRILACPEDSVSSFKNPAEKAGFRLLAGPKEDVLSRFCLAIRGFGISRLIRATGDNPFVFTDAAIAINTEAEALNADYSGYSGLPLGAGVESVDTAALLRAEAEAVSPYEREHVCPYLYGNPQAFRLHRPLAPPRWRDDAIRLTVDTEEDYCRAKELYSKLGDETDRYLGAEIIKRYREIFPR